jgi:hypothetical protein
MSLFGIDTPFGALKRPFGVEHPAGRGLAGGVTRVTGEECTGRGRNQRAMDEPRAQRTLVKSPPELWAEVSDVEALAGHLGAFGEIRITRLEPETTVAWEGDRARGTVELEPSGWGTKVTLTALIAGAREDEPEPAAAPEPVARVEPEVAPSAEPEDAPAPEPEAEEAAPEPARRRGLFARLFGRRRETPASAALTPDPEPEAAVATPPAPAPEPAPPVPTAAPAPAASERGRDALDTERAEAILTGVLDDLGAARHRPFSRG